MCIRDSFTPLSAWPRKRGPWHPSFFSVLKFDLGHIDRGVEMPSDDVRSNWSEFESNSAAAASSRIMRDTIGDTILSSKGQKTYHRCHCSPGFSPGVFVDIEEVVVSLIGSLAFNLCKQRVSDAFSGDTFCRSSSWRLVGKVGLIQASYIAASSTWSRTSV